MIEEMVGAVFRAQSRRLKRKAAGAVIEVAALGLVGFATIFALIGLFLLLADKVAPWTAAFIVACTALLVAFILFLVGNSMMKKRSRESRDQIDEIVAEFLPLAQSLTGQADLSPKATTAIVGAALAAGVILGRSLHRE